MSNNMTDELSRIRGVLGDLGGIAPQQGQGNNYRWYSLPKSVEEVKVRILPHWTNPNAFPAQMVVKHYQVPVVEQNTSTSANCLRISGLDCPICNTLMKYEQQFDGVSKHRPVPTLYFNVLVLQGPPTIDKQTGQQYTPDPNMPHIMGFRESFYKFIEETLSKPESSMILDPFQGADIYIKRKVANGAFEYRLAFGQRPVAPDQASFNHIMSNVFKLDDIWKAPDDDTVRKLMERANVLDQAIQGKILAAQGATTGGTNGNQNYQQSFTGNQPANNGYQQAPPQQQAPAQQQAPPTQNYQQAPPAQNGQQMPTQPETPPPAQNNFDANAQAQNIMGGDQNAAQNNQINSNLGTTTPTQHSQGVNASGGDSNLAPNPTATGTPPNTNMAQPQGDIPPGAPQCYGNAAIHSPQNQQCVDCKYELHCMKAAGKEPGY